MKNHNCTIYLYDGDLPQLRRTIVGVPNKLSVKQRKEWEPYLNVNDERGVVGTLRLKELRKLKRWLERVHL